MDFSFFDLIIIVGMAQAIFTCYLLLSVARNKASNRLLASVLIIFTLLSFKILLHTLGLWQFKLFRYFPLAIDLTIQPLVYLYILSLTVVNYRLTKKQLLHFLPAAVFLIHALVVYLIVQRTDNLDGKDVLAEKLNYNRTKQIEDYLSVLSFWVYWVLSFSAVKNYRDWFNNNTADLRYPGYHWLLRFLLIIGVLVLSLTLNIFLDNTRYFGTPGFYHWQIFYVLIAIAIYYLAIHGYGLPQIILPPHTREQPVSVSFDSGEVGCARDRIIDSLVKDKVFKDPEISLASLSRDLGLSQNLVSYTINSQFNRNFRNVINSYRVGEVKEMLKSSQAKHLSLLGIALECGFNSETSFYRIFKKETGMSPKEYMKRD